MKQWGDRGTGGRSPPKRNNKTQEAVLCALALYIRNEKFVTPTKDHYPGDEVHGKKTSMGALSSLVLCLDDPWPCACRDGKGPWILLTPPQECLAREGAVPEAAGTTTSQSEKGEHMQIQDG